MPVDGERAGRIKPAERRSKDKKTHAFQEKPGKPDKHARKIGETLL